MRAGRARVAGNRCKDNLESYGKAEPASAAAVRPVQARLCVANLVPRKGHLVLVRALAGIRDLDWRRITRA